MLFTHALALSANNFFCKKKSLQVWTTTSVRIKIAKLIIVGTRITYQATGNRAPCYLMVCFWHKAVSIRYTTFHFWTSNTMHDSLRVVHVNVVLCTRKKRKNARCCIIPQCVLPNVPGTPAVRALSAASTPSSTSRAKTKKCYGNSARALSPRPQYISVFCTAAARPATQSTATIWTSYGSRCFYPLHQGFAVQ